MKKILLFSMLAAFIASGCGQKTREPEKAVIANTLKSISFFSDSANADVPALFRAFENVNQVVDSLGYPDAGYKLWQIQSDTVKNIRFMVEGAWPDQAIYDNIHNNQKYKDSMKEVAKLGGSLKSVSYNRFILVK